MPHCLLLINWVLIKKEHFMNVAFFGGVTVEGQTENCCRSKKKPQWLKYVDLVCRVALGVFAGFLAPLPLIISLSMGIGVGSLYWLAGHWSKELLMSSGETKPVCAQGYMDYLSGIRFPPVIGSMATATFIAAHMRHDPQFYVPFCGVFIGFWIGREGADLGGRAFSFFKPNLSP